MSSLLWANLATVIFAQSLEKTSCEITPPENVGRPGFQIRGQEVGKKEIVRATTPSQTAISSPSLWWAVEKYDPLDGKLITYWEANSETRMIHLVVNNRFWQTLDYLDQYSLINQLGTVARQYNYNLSLISQQEDCLATYTCNLQVTPASCKINFNTF
ncbi:MAG: hypothetical protein RI580_06130 [Halothece sp. Uz-M2-17]|nr:hypothetical protein [Halothece sp. Uz-M2-17]